MNYRKIARLAADVYEECNIRRVPIDCGAILKHYGLRTVNINTLKNTHAELYRLCLFFSEDAFLFREKKLIIYRNRNHCRTRFSLMHELGHYLMNHFHCSPNEEREANHFASCVLAPRPLIACMDVPEPATLSKCFDISRSAAEIALIDYYRWQQFHGREEGWEVCLRSRLIPEYSPRLAARRP